MELQDNASRNEGLCEISECLQCDLCRAVNYEEERTPVPETKNAIKALYGTEVLFYLFYFPQHKKASVHTPHRIVETKHEAAF